MKNDTITVVPGIKVGHAHDTEALTGVTVILCEAGTVGGVDVRGTATGTRELNPLSATHLVEHINAVCLAGGSAFGLDAAGGVMRYLEERGIGFPVGKTVIPIVPAAILFDLNVGDYRVRPDTAMGYRACEAASTSPVEEGCVGAGIGASVGKLLGRTSAMKSGIGSAGKVFDDGFAIGAVIAVNAFGDILDPADGKIIAGSRNPQKKGEFLDTAKVLSGSAPVKPFAPENTTLAVVALNAKLTKSQAEKVAQMAQVGLAKTISPCHSTVDGDIIFALATGSWNGVVNLNRFGILAGEVVAEAVLRAVKKSVTMDGLPAWGDW